MMPIQDKKIQELREMVNVLLYTSRYEVNEFSWKELPNKEVEVFFEIKREDLNGDIIYQEGTVYITPHGRMYFLNFMGNKKNFSTIQSVVNPFHYKE